ncbi:MAG: hypothetical protein ACMG6E_03565 [Candidatus Roizmanbacteria bacterium]
MSIATHIIGIDITLERKKLIVKLVEITRECSFPEPLVDSFEWLMKLLTENSHAGFEALVDSEADSGLEFVCTNAQKLPDYEGEIVTGFNNRRGLTGSNDAKAFFDSFLRTTANLMIVMPSDFVDFTTGLGQRMKLMPLKELLADLYIIVDPDNTNEGAKKRLHMILGSYMYGSFQTYAEALKQNQIKLSALQYLDSF